jgi:hypothetical protein
MFQKIYFYIKNIFVPNQIEALLLPHVEICPPCWNFSNFLSKFCQIVDNALTDTNLGCFDNGNTLSVNSTKIACHSQQTIEAFQSVRFVAEFFRDNSSLWISNESAIILLIH